MTICLLERQPPLVKGSPAVFVVLCLLWSRVSFSPLMPRRRATLSAFSPSTPPASLLGRGRGGENLRKRRATARFCAHESARFCVLCPLRNNSVSPLLARALPCPPPCSRHPCIPFPVVSVVPLCQSPCLFLADASLLPCLALLLFLWKSARFMCWFSHKHVVVQHRLPLVGTPHSRVSSCPAVRWLVRPSPCSLLTIPTSFLLCLSLALLPPPTHYTGHTVPRAQACAPGTRNN